MNDVDLFFISDTWSVDTTFRSWIGPTCSPSNFNYLASKLGLSKGKKEISIELSLAQKNNADICAVPVQSRMMLQLSNNNSRTNANLFIREETEFTEFQRK